MGCEYLRRVIVISESSSQLAPSSSARDIEKCTRAAELAGCRVYYIPQDFEACENADGALWQLPLQSEATSAAVWIGYVPSFERYREIYAAALAKNARLLNDLEEHRRAQEFDSAYPHLVGLTPESAIITQTSECAAAAESLGFPIFVKGVVQSRKARGWKACVAENLEELQRLVSALLTLENRSRGRVVLRKLVRLRHARKSAEDFPFGREYRLFIYRGQILGMGYYWEGDDPLKTLSEGERKAVESLALEAAARLNVPYIAVDIGQREDREWIVIETGDAQFSGISTIPVLELWHRIAQIAD